MLRQNYASVSPYQNSESANWCLSAKFLGKKQQARVELPDGKSYDYISRYPVREGDIAIIGNTYAFGSSVCDTRESPNTGLFGLVSKTEDKVTIRKEYAVELDFVFTQDVNKTAIKQCANYLKLDDYEKTLQFNAQTSPVRPINHFIRRFLAAASILANESFADRASVELAKKAIAEIPEINETIFDLWYGCWSVLIELTQIYLPDIDSEAELKRFSKKAFVSRNGLDGREHPYDTLLKNPKVQEYIKKYSYLGAISIMTRGGLNAMLMAFLTAAPPIASYKKTILQMCEGSEAAVKLVKTWKAK